MEGRERFFEVEEQLFLKAVYNRGARGLGFAKVDLLPRQTTKNGAEETPTGAQSPGGAQQAPRGTTRATTREMGRFRRSGRRLL